MKQRFLSNIFEVEDLLKEKKIFLIHSKSFDNLYIKDVFKEKNVEVFTEFTPNPKIEQVSEAVKKFAASDSDIIAAVGGGSSIDVAKCVKLFSSLEEKDYLNREKWQEAAIDVLAIPTTAGSGSESTKHAVVYKEGIKQSVSHESILPDYVFLDGKLLSGLPEYQKKSTMLDALCQAIESCWSRKANEESTAYGFECIDLIRTFNKPYLEGDIEAAGKVLYASNQAGKAINITATTAAHAMSYGITSRYGIPHGHAVALCMCAVWKNLDYKAETKAMEADILTRYKRITERITRFSFVEIMKEMGMLNTVVKTSEDDIKELTKGVNPERLGNHPVKLTENELEGMYKEITGFES